MTALYAITGFAYIESGDSMENFISEILRIEQNAQDRIEEAEKKCIQIIADAKIERENIINDKIKEADNRIKMMQANEKNKADNELAVIEKKMNDEINRITEIYNEHHSEWETNLFNQIITN